MNPLYRNDSPGTFPESYYAATADIPPVRAPLDGDTRADLVVVGFAGGYWRDHKLWSRTLPKPDKTALESVD